MQSSSGSSLPSMATHEHAPLTLREVAALLRPFPHRWWVAGGWAIDLFLDQKTREHQDIEVALLRRDQHAMREHLADWELYYVADHELHAWPEGERLELPIHEAWARRRGDPRWRLELLLNECRDGKWLYRRDVRIKRPLEHVGLTTAAGLPVLAPEIVLLYKARHAEPKDAADLTAVLPALDDGRRRWLRAALDLVHPGHPWVSRLGDAQPIA